MRWLKISIVGLLFLTPFLSLFVTLLPLSAASSVNITITAVGSVGGLPGVPSGFTVTYISDYEIGLSWILGLGTNNTMIRAEYGKYPANRTDGYLVYYGNGTFCNDTAVNLDDPPEVYINDTADDLNIYYRAWSQDANGTWEETGSTGWAEGVTMKLIAMVVLCMGLIGVSYWRKNSALFMLAMLAWIGLAFWCRSLTPEWGTWDLNEMLFYIGFLAAFFCLIEAVMINREEQAPEPRPPRKESAQEYWDKYNAMMGRVKQSSTRIKRR